MSNFPAKLVKSAA